MPRALLWFFFLLFIILRRLPGATWRSAMVAELVGVAPRCTSSRGAWVSARRDVLSTLFFRLTLPSVRRYAQRKGGGGGGGVGGWGGVGPPQTPPHLSTISLATLLFPPPSGPDAQGDGWCDAAVWSSPAAILASAAVPALKPSTGI